MYSKIKSGTQIHSNGAAPLKHVPRLELISGQKIKKSVIINNAKYE
jgi:hypothetical protein